MITLSTGSLYTYGLDRVFDLAADAGFDGIELMVDGRWDARHVSYLRTLMRRHDLPILAVHSPFTLSIAGWPDDGPGRIKQSVQLAEGVGARVVVAHLPHRVGRWVLQGRGRRLFIPVPWSDQNDYRRWLVDELESFRASTTVAIAIENMPAVRFLGWRVNPCHWNDIDEILRFSPLTLDTTHLGTWGIDPVAVYRAWGDSVAHVHLSNFNGSEHRLVEDGHLRLDRFLALLAADGYAGIIALEFNPGTLQAESERLVRENLIENLAFCRQHFA
ncbi:MAG: hypothetical protein MAG451_01742 [Anaerolineales bacterium]|nr:hypothetical protein [Anaerolineales bacterium]